MTEFSRPTTQTKSIGWRIWYRIRIFLAMVAVLILLFLFVVPPSSWLIPTAPLIPGGSGMMILSSPEIEPRWMWLRLRGCIAVPALKDALVGGSGYSRINATRILQQRKDSSLISDFENAINKGGDVDSLCIAIGYTGGPKAMPALQRIATNPSMKDSALRGMGWTADPAALPILIAEFRARESNGTYSQHRTAASQALASFYGVEFESQILTWQKDGTFNNDELKELCRHIRSHSKQIIVMRALGLNW